MTDIGLVWIREDFRIENNAALSYATQNHKNVIAFFIYNNNDYDNKREAQKWWLSRSLENFKKDLSNYQINLQILSGDEIDIFSKIKIGNHDLLVKGKKSSEIDLVAKFVINELQNWWKSRIDSEKIASNTESLILISIDSEDIKKSFFIEEAIFEIIGMNNAKIRELC